MRNIRPVGWIAVFFSAALHARAQEPAPPTPQESLAKEVRIDLGAGYTIEPLEDLFVVATNADRPMLERCKGTVRRAYRALTRTYFEKKPDRPLSVYLFRDKTSYEDYTVRHYKADKPSTPFGFYWPSERKLVMNIDTGTGTLVHEMVHPLLAADFPEAPVWFNEGLASLYEQCQFEDEDRIRGLVNWRLPALQTALAGHRLISLVDLTALPTDKFYDDTRLPYAEARYLCMYLQEQGRLVDFYKRFRSNAAAADPAARDRTGDATLVEVTGESLTGLEKKWLAWVKTLHWERPHSAERPSREEAAGGVR